MMLIGVDPHNSTHTATALDPATNSHQGSIRIDAAVAASVAAMHGGARPVHRKHARTPSPYSMSDGKPCPRTELVRLINCTHCSAAVTLSGGRDHPNGAWIGESSIREAVASMPQGPPQDIQRSGG